MAESMPSPAIVFQVLFIVTMNDLPMSKEGVMMGRIFVSVCGVR